MNAAEQTTSGGTLVPKIARIELWFGLILIALPMLRIFLRSVGFEIALEGRLELLPLLLSWTGMFMFLAGRVAGRFSQHFFLAQLPLVLWLIVFALAFV